MSEMIYLDDYPIALRTDACWAYMHNAIEWALIAENVREQHVTSFDVSDCISIFPRLSLDQSYSLICFVSREYHGIWGRVAAVKKDAAREPIIIKAKGLFGPEFKLPDTATPPMEAVYNDGTPEGYFDALIFEQLLHTIPYVKYERKPWNNYQFGPPDDFNRLWDKYVEITDWVPRVIEHGEKRCTILAYRLVFENGLGSSDGRSKLYLTEHSFQDGLKFYHWGQERNGKQDTMYPARIDDDSRYTLEKRCCVSTATSILVARQKPY